MPVKIRLSENPFLGTSCPGTTRSVTSLPDEVPLITPLGISNGDTYQYAQNEVGLQGYLLYISPVQKRGTRRCLKRAFAGSPL